MGWIGRLEVRRPEADVPREEWSWSVDIFIDAVRMGGDKDSATLRRSLIGFF
ncbi:MAG: hypothetical protein OSJ56_08925 [Prevotella sp.]|nr:hypothetical protein [Prevotella sp.]